MEMERVIKAFRSLGMRIEYGGTLMHRWSQVERCLKSIEGEFLPPDKGCNIIVAHGSPLTFVGSNTTYIGLDRYIRNRYRNVFVGTVEGILSREEVLSHAKACLPKRVRFIPFMYVAGDHIMNDIMGRKPNEEGIPSWSMEMESAGFSVSTVYTKYKGEELYKGLGFYRGINEIFIDMLLKSLKRLYN